MSQKKHFRTCHQLADCQSPATRLIMWLGIYNPLLIDGKSETYLIFVIFFTQAKFSENKIYTEKRQFFALNM